MLSFIRTANDVEMPVYMTRDSSGMDVYAYTFENVIINPGCRQLIKTGLKLAELTPGYEIQIRSRSGLAYKNGIIVLNSPGTIDNDYRGEIGVILYNSSDQPFIVEKNMRIAQMVICPIVQINPQFVEESSNSSRLEQGFGSTGIF